MAQPAVIANAVANAQRYPENLGQQNFWSCDLTEFRTRLENNSIDLFDEPASARLDFLQLNATTLVFEEQAPTSERGLTRLLLDYARDQNRPKCQHFFIGARNSRCKLRVTKPMVQALLSHHSVMPMFLDFLFTFRQQQHKKNFDFSGFKTLESWIDKPLSPSPLGQELQLQMVYNLRCIEPAKNPPEWPWSMRQTVVYHSFDLKSGDAVWIVVKSNKEISPRIKSLVSRSAPSDPENLQDAQGAFRASLATHQVYCEWAAENWAAHVGFLEDQLHKTRDALIADVPQYKRSSVQTNGRQPGRVQTAPDRLNRRRSTLRTFAHAGRKRLSDIWHGAFQLQALAKPTTIPEETSEVKDPSRTELEDVQDFRYADLSAVQHIEDKANIAASSIKSNVIIIGELLEYYKSLKESEEFKTTLGSTCDPALRRCAARLQSILNGLKLHLSKVEALLHLLADRKALLHQLFAHRNMLISRDLTTRAQESAEKMEDLTTHMKDIAEKTEKETIFMRIITVVTLFFLPGTFVAVSRLYNYNEMAALISQTLMSTDIVKFQNDNKLIHRFSWQALVMYIGLTGLLMGITIWAAFSYRRKAQRALRAKRGEDLETGNIELEIPSKA